MASCLPEIMPGCHNNWATCRKPTCSAQMARALFPKQTPGNFMRAYGSRQKQCILRVLADLSDEWQRFWT